MVNIIIDGKNIQAKEGSTLLESAVSGGIKIPTLCYLKEVSTIGACRLCVVEVEGMGQLVTSCNTPVKEGMVVRSRSEKVIKSRKMTLDLILSNHSTNCFPVLRMEIVVCKVTVKNME